MNHRNAASPHSAAFLLHLPPLPSPPLPSPIQGRQGQQAQTFRPAASLFSSSSLPSASSRRRRDRICCGCPLPSQDRLRLSLRSGRGDPQDLLHEVPSWRQKWRRRVAQGSRVPRGQTGFSSPIVEPRSGVPGSLPFRRAWEGLCSRIERMKELHDIGMCSKSSILPPEEEKLFEILRLIIN